MHNSVKVESSGKEYPDMTKDQIKIMVTYLREGLSEEEAKEKAMNNG